MNVATGPIVGRGRSLAGSRIGIELSMASRTMRRCTPNLQVIKDMMTLFCIGLSITHDVE